MTPLFAVASAEQQTGRAIDATPAPNDDVTGDESARLLTQSLEHNLTDAHEEDHRATADDLPTAGNETVLAVQDAPTPALAEIEAPSTSSARQEQPAAISDASAGAAERVDALVWTDEPVGSETPADATTIDESAIQALTDEQKEHPTPPISLLVQDRTQPTIETTRIAPIKRGGRPRGVAGSTTDDIDGTLPLIGDDETASTRQPLSRPELVCWRHGREWLLGVELRDDWLDQGEPEIVQAGEPLHWSVHRDGVWELRSLDPLTLRVAGESMDVPVLDDAGEPVIIFKLTGPSFESGRRVHAARRGSLLFVVPENWQSATDLGKPLRAPEPVAMGQLQAHFFELGGSLVAPTFVRPSGETVACAAIVGSTVELSGEVIRDARPNAPPLFGQTPPMLIAPDATTWDAISTIVVGEEGGGRGRWRAQFSPIAGQACQSLAPMDNRPGGWYFVRVYDRAADLVDSFSFRYLRGFSTVKLLPPDVLPTASGHVAADVSFVHDSSCKLSLAEPASRRNVIAIRPTPTGSRVTIPPDASLDSTVWRITSALGASVETAVVVERVWWAIGQIAAPPDSSWIGNPLDCAFGDLRATSPLGLWLKLPSPEWTGRLSIGFDRDRATQLRPSGDATIACVPLRQFGDDPVLTPSHEPASLHVWCRRDDSVTSAVVLRVHLPAPTPPPSAEPQSTPAAEPAASDAQPSPADARTGMSAPRTSSQHRPKRQSSLAGESERDAAETLIEEHILADTGDVAIDDERYIWLAVHCRQGSEASIQAQLHADVDRRGLRTSVPTVIAPVVESLVQKQGRRKSKAESLGYVFVQVAKDFDWRVLTHEISARIDGSPIPPDEVRHFLNYKRSEVELPHPGDVFTEGCRVRVIGGPLNGRSGVVMHVGVGKRQVTITLDGSTSATTLTLPLDSVDLISRA